MTSTADRLVDDYLRRLSAELSAIPRSGRREVIDEISEHIADGRAALDAESEADVRTLLDRIGDPADIGAEARDRFGIVKRATGLVEVAALVLLLVGGLILPVIGWFIGLVLLWASEAWTNRDKLIGTLVLPGGWLFALGLLFVGVSAESCSNDVQTQQVICTGGTSATTQIFWVAVVIVASLAPIVTTVYLARRMGRRPVPSLG